MRNTVSMKTAIAVMNFAVYRKIVGFLNFINCSNHFIILVSTQEENAFIFELIHLFSGYFQTLKTFRYSVFFFSIVRLFETTFYVGIVDFFSVRKKLENCN